METFLAVENLSVSFRQYQGGLRQRELRVISDLNVSVNKGEIVAVVGSSGSGKSLLAHAVLGILPANALLTGKMTYLGEDLTPTRQARLRGQEIALIPQSVNFLDPLMRVEHQLVSGRKSREEKINVQEVLNRYRLKEEVRRLFPFQLSGGMARRVLVATAVTGDARLIIADEPTPGLHDQVANETLAHFRELADQGRGIMLITHDLEGALTVADRIAVFYAGTTVEIAPKEDFMGDGEGLRHPYSRALWQALPRNGFKPMPGYQPYPEALPPGCLFAPRCHQAGKECGQEPPEMRYLRGGLVRCLHAS